MGPKVHLVAKETLMFDRPSFDPRYSHGQQAGGSVVRRQQTPNGIPAMFLPNYSGDGQGKVHSSAIKPNATPGSAAVRTTSPNDGEMPVWSGDGRRNVVNPMMPVYQADGRSSFGLRNAGRTRPPQVLPASSDGQGSVDLSQELSMTVNAPAVDIPAKKAKKQTRTRRVKRPENARSEARAERSEMWKLVALVVIFLIWISTASTLLFLYMDRYLFP